MSDPFEEVKVRFEEGWPSAIQRMRDIAYLISEVERLRQERTSFIAEAAIAVEQMRASAESERPR